MKMGPVRSEMPELQIREYVKKTTELEHQLAYEQTAKALATHALKPCSSRAR